MTIEVPCGRHEQCGHAAALLLDGYDDPSDARRFAAICRDAGVAVWIEDRDTGTL